MESVLTFVFKSKIQYKRGCLRLNNAKFFTYYKKSTLPTISEPSPASPFTTTLAPLLQASAEDGRSVRSSLRECSPPSERGLRCSPRSSKVVWTWSWPGPQKRPLLKRVWSKRVACFFGGAKGKKMGKKKTKITGLLCMKVGVLGQPNNYLVLPYIKTLMNLPNSSSELNGKVSPI